MKQRRNPAFGFSLIEAAIVLAIVGLVIGGIWVAAAAVQTQQKAQDFMRLYTVVKQSVQSLQRSTAMGSSSGLYDALGTTIPVTQIPGSYKARLVSNSYGSGSGYVFESGGVNVLFYEAANEFALEIYFAAPRYDSSPKVNSALCTQIMKFLGDEYKRGTIPDATITKTFMLTDSGGSATAIDYTSSTLAFPTTADITSACANGYYGWFSIGY